MTRRAWALAAVSVVGVLAGVPALAAAPQQGASMLSDDAERKAHEALERDRRERDLARARAARSPNPRRLAGQSDRQALQTALDTFPRLFAVRPTGLLATRPDERVVAYLGDYAARLDVPGKADAIVSSDLPLRVGANGIKRPVDLVLVDRGDRFGPKDPIVDATFPRRADAALTVGDSVALKLLGADPEAVAQQAGQQLVYPNALRDADLLATPLPTGLETFVQLRSADSPTDLAFGFELPSGARLVADRDGTTPAGGVSIVRGGVEIGRVHPPSAVDAAGDPVAVTTSVRDATLTLDVDVRADTPFPVLVDPIVEGQWDNPNDPNGGFVYANGWRRDSSVGLAGFLWTPNADSPDHGATCLRPSTHAPNDPDAIEPINNAICVSTFPTLNYPLSISPPFQSVGAWTWRPPAGVRSSANDLPAPDTDAFLFRADVRNGYLDLRRDGGNAAMLAGLISGRTHTWIGNYGVIFEDEPGLPPVTSGGTSPFLRETSNSSFFGTYCAHSSCTAELDDPVYDGTYMAFGVWAAGTGQQASAIGQGAQLYQSDRTPPSVLHVAVSDPTQWYRSDPFTSRVAAGDNGMGMDRMGVTFARPSPLPPYFDGDDLPCRGISTDPCPRTMSATSYTYDTGLMPEGRNTVNGSGIDIIGRTTFEPMRASADAGAPAVAVKVDRTTPTLAEIGGTLTARNGRAVVDDTYTATARVRDALSGVETLGYAIDGGPPITQPSLSCPDHDCPQDPDALELEIDTSQLTVGEHTISVYAKDSADNELRQVAWRFVVDHDPPSITALRHAPPATGWIGSRTQAVEADATDDASGVKRFSLTTPTAGGATTTTDVLVAGCDDAVDNLCPAAVTRSVEYATGAMGDGPARPVSLVAADALGQESAESEWTVNVDTAGPDLALSGPAWDARDGYIGGTDLPLSVAAVDSVGGERRSGVAEIVLRIDGELVAERERDEPCVTTADEACDLDASFTIRPGDLDSGEHTVTVTATDDASPANTTTRSFAVWVDREAPAVTATTHDPAPPQAWRDDVPRSVALSAHDELSGVERFTLSLPGIGMPQVQPVACSGPPAAPCPNDANATFSYATTGFPQGASTIAATAIDAADNASPPAEWTVRVDRTAPAVAYSGSLTQLGGQLLIGGSADLRIDAADGHSGVKLIRVLVDGQEKLRREATCTPDGCPSTLSDTIVIAANDYLPGTHTVRVEVSDLVGAPAARHVATEQFTFVNVAVPITDETSPQGTLGFEDWQSYDDHPTGAGSAAHVNLTSGNALWSHTFLENPGRGIDSVGRLTYNSQEPGLLSALPLLNGIPLVSGLISSDYNQVGRGFSLQVSGVTRLNQPLEFVGVWLLNPTPTSVRLVDGDGTRHTFTQVTPGQPVYQGPPGTHLRLRAFNASGPRRWAMTRPDGVTYFFDADGYITQIADRVGNVMAFEYQSVPTAERLYTQCGRPSTLLVAGCPKRVIRITDAAGVAEGAANRSVHVAYVPFSLTQPAAGMIDSISDHAGRVTKFGYDNQRRLQTVTEAAGTPVQRSFSLAYDASSSGYLHTVSDPRGSTSKIAYEPQGLLQTSLRRMTGFADRATRGTTYGYARTTLDGATVSNAVITDPKGRVTQVRMDGRQRLVEHVDARSKHDRWTWDDAVNKPVRHVEAQGTADEAITKWEWGSLGQLEKAFEPFNAVGEAGARFTDFDYQLSRGTFPGNDQALVVYDMTRLTRPEGNATRWVVNGLGQIEHLCEPDTPCRTYAYGVGGLLTRETDPQDEAVEYFEHDASGLPRRVRDERGNDWHRRYDEVGNVLAIRDPRGAGVAPPADLPARTGYTARFTYDALDRRRNEVIPKLSAAGEFVERSYDYDGNDNETARVDGNGATWTTTYTVTDQVQERRSPVIAHHGETSPSSEVTRFAYDATDQVEHVRAPLALANGSAYETRYAYDAVDQPVVERRRSSEPEPASGIHELVTSWAYDLRGNRVGVVDPNTNVEANDATAAANAADPVMQRVAYEYDVADRLHAETQDPAGSDALALRTTYGYDDNDNLTSVVAPRGNDPSEPLAGSFRTTYRYDTRDLLVEESDALGRVTHTERRQDGRPVAITSPRGTKTSTPGDFVTRITYDAAGETATVTSPRHSDQYGPTVRVEYTRNKVGDPETITDGRGRSFQNRFLDTGELRYTERPSWWSGGAGDDDRGLPETAGHGDFGEVRPQDLPGLLPRAGATTLAYDDELRLESVRDAVGKTQKLGYDDVGRLVRHEIPFKDGEARPDEGCPEGVREPSAGPIVLTYRYDANGNRRSMVDGRCQETTWEYDQFDRLAKLTAPASWDGPGAVTTTRHDRNGNVVRRGLPRDPARAIESMAYDAVDRLVSMTEPFDEDEGSPRSQWRYRYDANGNRVREVRPRSQEPGAEDARFTTRMAYDEADQLTTVTNGIGHVTTYGYDADGNRTDVVAPGAARSREDAADVRTQVSHTEFDGRGLPWVQRVGSGADARTTVTEYDGNGNLRRSVRPRGVQGDRPEFPDVGRDVAMTPDAKASWNATVFEYDDDNLMRARYLPWSDADGNERWKQTQRYEDRGWLVAVSDVFSWDGSNSAQFETRYEDHLDTGWVGRSIDKPAGSGPTQTVVYGYDHGGNQTLWRSENGSRRVERSFFPNGELERRRAIRTSSGGVVLPPEEWETRTYDYERNPAGELTKLIDRDPPRRDPVQPGQQPVVDRTTSIVRDVAGRVASVNETWGDGRDTVYEYGVGGLIERVSVDGRRTPSGGYERGRTMTYSYDALDRVDDVAVREDGTSSARHTGYDYWPSDQVSRVTKANGTVERRFFDTAGRYAQRTVDPADAAVRVHDYAYDANANRRVDERGEYAYNARDQLVRWEPSASGLTRPTRVTYEPAGDGRLLRKVESFAFGIDRTTTNAYTGERLMSAEVRVTGGGDASKDLRYAYDNFGSLLTIKTAPVGSSEFKTTTQYTYDPFERLLSSRDDEQDGDADDEADGPHVVFCYDALDRRDRKVTGVEDVPEQSPEQDSFAAQREACERPPSGSDALDYSYLGLGEQLTRESTPDGAQTYDYTPDGERLGQRSAGEFRPYETDSQGSVVALEREAGGPAASDRYELDPYGDALNADELSPAAKANPFRYQGFYLDAGTGTYDMQARAYRPSLGRFLSQDRFEDPRGDLLLQQDPLTNNRYAFLAGNPTSTQEYNGHACITLENCNGIAPFPDPPTRARASRGASERRDQPSTPRTSAGVSRQVAAERDAQAARRAQEARLKAQLAAALAKVGTSPQQMGQLLKDLVVPGSVGEAAFDLVAGKFVKLGQVGKELLEFAGRRWLKLGDRTADAVKEVRGLQGSLRRLQGTIATHADELRDLEKKQGRLAWEEAAARGKRAEIRAQQRRGNGHSAQATASGRTTQFAPTAKAMPEGKPFAMGISDHLDDFARTHGADTWKHLDDPVNWRPGVLQKLQDPNQRVLFNLDDVEVWPGVTRAASGRGGATDWELLQLRNNSFPNLEFWKNGRRVEGPFK